MCFLIDGYNLLFALGWLTRQAGPNGLLKARQRLLGWLGHTHGAAASFVTVVFDASKAPPGAVGEEFSHGIHVRYAIHQLQADDLIEDLIRVDSTPRQLSVVSDDHRIQQAARRRHCIVLKCGEYLDFLDRQRRTTNKPNPESTQKPQTLSAAETERWLAEFDDLRDSPELKELSDPHGYFKLFEEDLE